MTSSAKDPKDWRPSKAEVAAMRRLTQIIDLFLEVDKGLPLSQLRLFLEVALDPDKGPTEYSKRLGASQPHTSRNLGDLGQNPRNKALEPMRLLESYTDPMDRRFDRFNLTERGLSLINKVLDIAGVKRE